MTLTSWGRLPSAEEVIHVRLESDDVCLGLLTWGATVQSLRCRDSAGAWGEVVLGFDTLAPYLSDHPFLGCTVGRFANRIAGGSFVLDGTEHRLSPNDGPHTLHGGPRHFGVRNWILIEHSTASASLRLISPAGDMGFPGRLDVLLHVSLDGAVVRHELSASTDAATVVNLTNHAYVNLAGDPSRRIDDHELRIDAEAFLDVDEAGIPLPGDPTPVSGTPFDFRTLRPLGDEAFDHTFVLGGADHSIELRGGGRRLRIATTEPGVQLYTADPLDGSLVDRDGVPLGPRSGLCLETQHFPDSPHRPDYPSTRLDPGTTWTSVTTWDTTPLPHA